MPRTVWRYVPIVLIVSLTSQGCAPKIQIGPGSFLADLDTQSKVKQKIIKKVGDRKQQTESDFNKTTFQTDYESKTLAALEMEAPEDATSSLKSEFSEMLAQCKEALSTYERQSQFWAISAVGLAVLGAAAGAIVVPALTAAAPVANKAAIAAFGGFSGVTNVAQSTMKDQGLTSEEARATRENIRKEWKVALDKYSNAKNAEEKAAAINEGKIACINYALANPSVDVDKTEIPKKTPEQ